MSNSYSKLKYNQKHQISKQIIEKLYKKKHQIIKIYDDPYDTLLYKQILQLPIELRKDIYNIYEKEFYPKILLSKKRKLMNLCKVCVEKNVKEFVCLSCYDKVNNSFDYELKEYICNKSDYDFIKSLENPIKIMSVHYLFIAGGWGTLYYSN
jgi:hypothetical protein